MRRSSRIESITSNDLQLAKTEAKVVTKLISTILRKDVSTRTAEELDMLQKYDDTVAFLNKRQINNKLVKEREQEVEDTASELEEKCKKLALMIEESRNLVIYTGAGISTAASIPDYRGPQGVWTLLKQGKECKTSDLSLAEPTFTHMTIAELYKKGYVKRVVSQNCDGLHLRSGLPRSVLSELHGNMFLEVCRNCQPTMEYLRLFDVTEKTGMRRHKTGRLCQKCKSPLLDTIVHFGEKSPFQAPHNWHQATNAANKADMILCLGSSLKVLKKYSCLWASHKPSDEQPKLVIVNLQWTPKDKKADLKINGKCDDVMRHLMKYLNISMPLYNKLSDPLFHFAIPLLPYEKETTTKAILSLPEGFIQKSEGELRVKTQRRRRRRFGVKSASVQSDGEEEEEILSLYDEEGVVGLLQSRYHGNDVEVRRQPVRRAKVKQFLVRGKRKLEGLAVILSKHSKKTDEIESNFAVNPSTQFETPSSSTSDQSEEDRGQLYADMKMSKFNDNSLVDSTSLVDDMECSSESCCGAPPGTTGEGEGEVVASFSICPSMTPPPSIDCRNSERDSQFGALLAFDCDYASLEEVTSGACEAEGRKEGWTEEGLGLVAPGWFGKGVQVKKVKRKRARKQKQ